MSDVLPEMARQMGIKSTMGVALVADLTNQFGERRRHEISQTGSWSFTLKKTKSEL
jgi:hypothetical protein